jgi:hypothetical protein
MNRSELETRSRKQLLALAERAGVSGRRELSKAALIESLLSAAPESPAELPASYGRTRLTLVEIEPHWIHAYWEIAPPDCQAARAKAADGAWVLRFYDVTGVEFDGANARDSFDVPVDVSVGNWYVNLWSGGKTYCAEIGLRASGAFVPVSRSGIVQVPAATAAPRAEAEWMKVEPVTGMAAPAQEPACEEAHAPVVVAATENTGPLPAIAGTIVLPPAELPAVAVAVAGKADVVMAEHARVGLPKEFPLPLPLPPVAELGVGETGRWCEEMHAPSGSNGNGNGNAPLAIEPTAEREAAPSSHSVDRFGTSSDGLGAAERAPSIKLELNAEVIIYGRAMPGQMVEVCGRAVKVNPDGTFNVRMALPLADDAARAQ